MNVKTLWGLVLSVVCLTVASAQETGWEIDESQLPPGVTRQQVIQQLEELDRLTAQERAREEAELNRRVERVRRVAEKYQERILRAAEKDPELKALGEKLKAGFQALQNPELSEEEKAARLERMAPDMSKFRERGLAKANIDERAMNAEILKEINSGVVSRSADGGDDGEVVAGEGGAYYFLAEEEAVPESGVTSRGTLTYLLDEPWPYGINKIGIYHRDMSQHVDQYDGYYNAGAVAAYAGSGTNRAGLWHYYTVPGRGVKRINVDARISIGYSTSVSAVMAGGGHAKSASAIYVYDGSKLLCYKYKKHADVWGLVVGFFNNSSRYTLAVDCDFAAPPEGRKLTIKFHSSAYVSAWGIVGTAISRAGGRPKLEVSVTR